MQGECHRKFWPLENFTSAMSLVIRRLQKITPATPCQTSTYSTAYHPAQKGKSLPIHCY